MDTKKKLQQLKILFPQTSEEKLQIRAELEIELETKAKESQEQLQALPTPQSMNDLKSCLILVGKVKRYTDERAKVKADLSGLTIPRLKPRVVANILEKYLHIAKLGQNSEERAKSLAYYYDLDQGIYIPWQERWIQFALYVQDDLTPNELNQVMTFIRAEAKEYKQTIDPNLIVCNNKIYNRKTQKTEDFTPNYYFTTKLSTNYNEKAELPTFNGWNPKDWLNDLGDSNPQKIKLLWQVIAYTVNANSIKKHAFFFIDDGQGRTGKGTFQEMLAALVGEDNAYALRYKDFENTQNLGPAMNKALIIGDDNDPNFYNETSSNFKSMVTGDVILINAKYMQPYTARNTATIIQSMNGKPKQKDVTGGLLRRFKIIKFNHQYEDTPEGAKIKDDYVKRREVSEWLLKEAVKVDIGKIVDTEESKQLVHEMKIESDPVAYFMENHFNELKSTRIPVGFMFRFYRATREAEEGITKISMSPRTFTTKLRNYLPIGWELDTKNKTLGDYWNHKDKEVLKGYSVKICYDYFNGEFKSKRNKYQSLIFKKTKTE